MAPYLASREEFATFLARFRDGVLPRAEWNHVAHLAMAAAVVHQGPRETALQRVRESILTYAAAQGIVTTPDSGYHESLTAFWVERIQELLAGIGRGASAWDAARAAVGAFGHRARLFEAYYSYDIVKSREARKGYIPPDRAD